MSRTAVISCTAWLAALAFVAACRPGEGQRCVCQGECRGGLVCAQGGRTLGDNECVDPGDRSPGECIRLEEVAETSEGGEIVGDVPIYHDVGGKRDFEPGQPTASATDATSTAATTNDESSATSSSTASSSSTGTP